MNPNSSARFRKVRTKQQTNICKEEPIHSFMMFLFPVSHHRNNDASFSNMTMFKSRTLKQKSLKNCISGCTVNSFSTSKTKNKFPASSVTFQVTFTAWNKNFHIAITFQHFHNPYETRAKQHRVLQQLFFQYNNHGTVEPIFTTNCRFWRNYELRTMITVSDIVSLDTPPKNDAAPIKANAPGSIQAQYPRNNNNRTKKGFFM